MTIYLLAVVFILLCVLVGALFADLISDWLERKVYGLRFRGGHGTGVFRSGLPTTDDHPAPKVPA